MGQNESATERTLLVEQSGWVFSLAHHLVRDPCGADDVAQETMLAALAAPPRDASDPRRLRAWLGRVAFNLANLAMRRNGRRRAREETAACSEREVSTADRVIRTSVLEDVGVAVTDLAEPYRTAVEMRYFDGMTTADIAQATATTESAVRKRLWRARGQLRESLDGHHNGERQAWFQALAPLFAVPSVEGSLRASLRAGNGALAFKSAAGVALALGVGLAGAIVARELRTPREALPLASVARAATDDSMPLSTQRVREQGREIALPDVGRWTGTSTEHETSSRPDSPRIELAVGQGNERSVDVVDADGIAVHGSLIDLWGNPIGSVDVVDVARPNQVLGSSAADGSFALRVESLPVTLAASAPEFATLCTARVGEGEADWDQWLVLAPAVDVAGRVTDSLGRPLTGATVDVVYEDEVLVNLPLRVNLREVEPPSVTTIADGSFRLDRVASGGGVWLRAAHDGFESEWLEMPLFGAPNLAFALQASERLTQAIMGDVRDSENLPVRGALVEVGRFRTRTAGDGSFVLQTTKRALSAPLVVRKAGFGSTSKRGLLRRMRRGTLGDLRVSLDGFQSTIRGTVVAADGSQVSDWLVFASMIASETSNEPAGVEVLEDPYKLCTRTLADGSFQFTGVRDQAYLVIGFDPSSFELTDSAQVSGNAESVTLSPLGARESLRIRLVDQNGNALVGVNARASLELAGAAGSWSQTLAYASSDADGWVELPDLRGASAFSVEHPEWGLVYSEGPRARWFGAGAARFGRDSSLVVGLDAGIQVHAMSATSFALLDAAGSELELDGPTSSSMRGRLFDGRSTVLSVDAAAETIVWFQGKAEIGRTEITLPSGELSSLTQ